MQLLSLFTVSAAVALASALAHSNITVALATRQDAPAKMVFAHFMVGIVGVRTSASDYDADMKLAKSAGIDGFALNIGPDDAQVNQLDYAYESAANNDMKVFISFDFNDGLWDATNAQAVGDRISAYADKDGQLKVGDKPVVSSFVGDNASNKLDVGAVRTAAGRDIYFAPNFSPYVGTDLSDLEGALSWIPWQTNGANRAPDSTTLKVTEADQKYVDALGDGAFIAPVSPWFSTHYGTEVSYSKNWVFPSDLLWYMRWREILTLKPQFVEIITWNDYGESQYIGPLSSPHGDDGNSKWVNDKPHTGWIEMAKPFIQAYKNGDDDVTITEDKLIYWYRTVPKSVNCDDTDTTIGMPSDGGKPNGFDTMQDNLFIVAMLTSPGQVTVNSGGTPFVFDAPAGASSFTVPFSLGSQAFALNRDGNEVISEVSLAEIKNECTCGIYNFNAYVGTVPAEAVDSLTGDGFGSFTNGLKVDCAPQPSLPATPPATVAPSAPTTTATQAPEDPI